MLFLGSNCSNDVKLLAGIALYTKNRSSNGVIARLRSVMLVAWLVPMHELQRNEKYLHPLTDWITRGAN